MQIYHLYHSGVAIEYRNDLIIFDYYNDQTEQKERELSSGVVNKELLKNYTNIYIFVSHHHSDHYNPVIFQWYEYNSNIKYILSNDVEIKDLALKKNIYFVKKDDQLLLDNINISAYGSTDLGVSFLADIAGKSIFHAGDLNWWHWNSFTEEQLEQEEKDFKKEVNKLKGKKIDIAFIPVDPRLEENYYLAGEYFIKSIKPSLLVPIHFAANYSITEEFAKKFAGTGTRVPVIKKRGEKIIY